MSHLVRKSLRDLLAARAQALCVALLTAVVVVLVAGGLRAREMLLDSREVVYERLAHADLELRFAPTHPGVAKQARGVEGVAATEERLLLKGVLEPEGARPLPTLVRVLPAEGLPQLDRLRVLRGRLPRPAELALAVDRSLVGTHGLDVGTEVTLIVGERSVAVQVVGVVLSPEHLLWPVHPEYALPLRGTVGVVVASPAVVAHSPHAQRIDSLLVRTEPDASVDAVRAALREQLFVSVVAAPAADERPGHVFTERLRGIFDIYLPSTVVMVLIVALGLLVLTTHRMVAAQRMAIGTLLTQGHPPHRIARSMLVLGLAPAALGIVLGAALHGAVARAIFSGYAGSIGYVPLHDPGVRPVLALVATACLAVGGLTAYLPALVLASRRPSDLLAPRGRHAAPPAQGPLVRVAARVRDALGVPLAVLLGVTTVMRRRGTTLVAVGGLGISFALVIAFLLVHVTHRDEVEASAERMGLDATVHFEGIVAPEAIAELARRVEGEAEGIVSERVWLAAEGGGQVRRSLMVPPGRWLAKQRLVAGRRFAASDEPSILIDRWIAKDQGLDVGDAATVYPYPDAPEGASVEVVGILEGLSSGFAVLPLLTGTRLFQMEGMAAGAHVASSLPAGELTRRLWEAPDVEAVFALAPAVAQVRANFRGSERVLLFVLLMAAGVAVVFLAALAWIDAKERSHDLALLSALGWRGRSVLLVCLAEVLVRGVLALALGTLLAPWLARLLLARLAATDLPRMTLELPAWPFLVVAGAALVLMPLGALPAFRAARRVTPARALRILAAE